MPSIRRLPDDLINKIAAGEVVERPASVVKELVENALDAGARSVLVEIEGGGRALVRVRDDGSGMDREDAALAVERHATSKLRRLQDLHALTTSGFRGEALPSIASVSDLTLRTRTEGESAGTEVQVRHGSAAEVKDAGHPRGTTVEVRDLFGAVPARRKFLRSDATEVGHVAEAVTLQALARPGTGFSLRSGGRALLDAPSVASRRERLFQLLGDGAVSDLVEVDGGEGFCRVSGFVSRPERAAEARPALRLFVNGRPVRDRALAKAIGEGYRAAGVRDARPEAFLFLELPPHLVDVNVHPAKSEVRFADARVVFSAVAGAVREALRAAGPAAVAASVEAQAETAPSAFVENRAEKTVTPGRAAAPVFPEASPPLPGLFSGGPPTVLGQHRNTYIVASDGEHLLLLDQHTAHERVRFEGLLARLEAREVESQLLLAPVVAAFEPRLLPALEAHAQTLRDLGYDAEPFGAGTVRLRAIPASLVGSDPAGSLRALLRDLLEREASDWLVADDRSRLAATLACHSSVRAGQPLAQETMAAIVRDLATAAQPALCPHGRPTVVRIPRGDVSRWFGRAGWARQ
ncbi:MAG TPA: DNA mismatch repair endonuclease MutL [Vicinamibacteria bacterium]|nr:DNA mismatch repair endonuclease MutL [Vicinamibacteria bacterium]